MTFSRSTRTTTFTCSMTLAVLLFGTVHPAPGLPGTIDTFGRPDPAVGHVSRSPFSSPILHSFLSKRPIAVTLIGGIAAWMTSQVEDADMMVKTLDRDRFLLSGGIDLGDAYGNGATIAISSLGLILTGHIGNYPVLEDAGSDLTRSFLLTSAIVWSLKLGMNRQRPGGGNYSFPSGHTAGAFSAAPILYHHFGWKIGIPTYSLAALAGLGRMEDRRHYLSDVLFGAAIGIAVGDAVINKATPMKFLEHVSFDGRGITLHTGF